MTVPIEPIIGRYGQFDIDGTSHRIYWEEAGSGIPLLCLHTAGSDGRQYRSMLNNKDITDNYRVIVFDMPWHGKSSPPQGAQIEDYQLTSQSYINQILAVADGLELEKPVVMGCSIGGRIILYLALHHPERFRALIGLQTAPYLAPYYDTSWLFRPDVHGGLISGAVAYGLMAPQSPEKDRFETMWHYMQGGPGVFKGDLYFYKVDGDIRGQIDDIDPKKCPIYLLTGDYDYSGTPEDTRKVADQLGIDMVTMENMGHFPMSENPEKFEAYLLPVLNKISAG